MNRKKFHKILLFLLAALLMGSGVGAQDVPGTYSQVPGPKVPKERASEPPAPNIGTTTQNQEKGEDQKIEARDEPWDLSPEEEETALSAAQNPLASTISVPFQYSAAFGRDKAAQGLNVQPVLPLQLGEWNLVNRTIIPIRYLPLPGPGLPGGAELGLGDINHSAYLSPAEPGEIIWGVGPSITIPTATDPRLGSEKWSVGPTAIALTSDGPWLGGVLLNQQWSVAGKGGRDQVSTLLAQPFLSYNVPESDGWYLTSGPQIVANWKRPSGQRWTVPIGGGAGRVFELEDQPVNVSVQAYYNAIRPPNAPTWSLQFQFQLIFPTK